MRIGIVTPAPAGSTYGNRVTAVRWAKILRELGHYVSLSQRYDSESWDLLIALHARRSYASIKRFRRLHLQAPIIVALTGTDLYHDLPSNQFARESLEIADRIIVLQPKAVDELRPAWQAKTHVIYQSVANGLALISKSERTAQARMLATTVAGRRFDVCVIGHLRPVKDPFRAALAARLLPSSSQVRILQVGKAMTAAMEKRVRTEMLTNQRYLWLGEQPRSRTLATMARSQLCVISSRIEGGANVLSEAIVAGIPVLASRTNGNVGILGAQYSGLFDVGNTHELAQVLTRAETDSRFLVESKAHLKKLAPLFDPDREQRAWANLINQLPLNRD